MSVKILLLVVETLAVLYPGAAIKCYSCVGTKTSECFQSKISSMAVDKCERNSLITKDFLPGLPPNTTDSLKVQCVNTVIKPSNGYEEPFVLRGCAPTYENMNVCDLIEQAMPIESCYWCDDKDNCNVNWQ